MLKVGIIFGGRSVEHEVSVITGMQVIENMDKEKFLPIPIYITKEGKWLSSEAFKILRHLKMVTLAQLRTLCLAVTMVILICI